MFKNVYLYVQKMDTIAIQLSRLLKMESLLLYMHFVDYSQPKSGNSENVEHDGAVH